MTEKEARDIAYRKLNYDENGNPLDEEPSQILECVEKDEDCYVFAYTYTKTFKLKNTIYVDTKTGRALTAPT